MKAYEVELREEGSNPKLVVAPEGTLITSDLPKTAGAVQRLLLRRAPSALPSALCLKRAKGYPGPRS
jgi:hypothetical protein